MTFNKFHVPPMLTFHQIKVKNQFVTGIGSGYEKTLSQNELQTITRLGFTSYFRYVDYGKEDCHEENSAA